MHRETSSVLVVAAALVAPSTSTTAQVSSPRWPECAPQQVEVVLLGVYHMAGSRDDIQSDVDDVLSVRRQQEVAVLIDRLAAIAPDKIALEAGIEYQQRLNAWYAAYRTGAHELNRNERQQLGFRLAARLNHDSVYAVDFPMGIGNDSIGAFWERHAEVRRWSDRIVAAGPQRSTDPDVRLRASSLAEYLTWVNSEEALTTEGNRFMYAHLVAGEGSNYGGPDLYARWFERNAKIAHHVTRIVDQDDRRVLVIIGSGHVRPLRHLFDLAPQFCPVSPIPFLTP